MTQTVKSTGEDRCDVRCDVMARFQQKC